MNERFSDRARHAMALANLEAGKLKHADLRPAHLMLGLIAEGECVATEALRLLDVDLDKVRMQVCDRMEWGCSFQSRVGSQRHPIQAVKRSGCGIASMQSVRVSPMNCFQICHLNLSL